jgi:O-6-methylguanine DNA methyltransferase
VRAVGTAVGKNPITLVVPCHRVLAKGRTSQLKFGWGPEAKKRLLTAEGVTL